MKKKLLSAISAMMVMAMAITGCGGGGGSSTADTTKAATEGESKSDDSGDTKTDAKSDVTINYYSMWNEAEPQGQVVAEAVDAFKDKTGITVEVTWAGRDTRKTFEPAITSGTEIDIYDEDIERLNKNWGKYALNLEELAAKTYDTTGDKPYIDGLNQTLVGLARSLGQDGKLSSIPYQPSTFIMMYNKGLFKEAGITEVPKTWDEFLAVCEKIKGIGKTPITVDDAYMGCLMGYTLARTIGQQEALKLSQDVSLWDKALPAAQKWQEMYEKGYVSANAAANIWPAGQNEVARGDVAMYLNGTWLPNEIKNSTPPDFEWGSFAFPAIAPEGEGIEANNYGSQCFAVNKDSKNPEEAFQFIVFMTTGEYDVKLAQESLGVPMANNSEWPSQLADAKAILDSTTVRYPWGVGMEDNSDVHTKIKTNFAKLVSGGLDAQGFVDEMKK